MKQPGLCSAFSPMFPGCLLLFHFFALSLPRSEDYFLLVESAGRAPACCLCDVITFPGTHAWKKPGSRGLWSSERWEEQPRCLAQKWKVVFLTSKKERFAYWWLSWRLIDWWPNELLKKLGSQKQDGPAEEVPLDPPGPLRVERKGGQRAVDSATHRIPLKAEIVKAQEC